MKILLFFLFVTCLNFCCSLEENNEAKNETNIFASKKNNDYFLCILTSEKCNQKNGIFTTQKSIINNPTKLNRVKRKGGRGGGGGFRGASAARASLFSATKLSSSSRSRGAAYGGGGYGSGTYIYAGNSYHQTPGTWPNGPSDVIFVIVLLIGSAVFLVCLCSYLSRDDATNREKAFIPPKRYPQPPKQKVYTYVSTPNNNNISQNPQHQHQRYLPPPIYEV